MPEYPTNLLPLPSWSLGNVNSTPKAITDMDEGLPRQRQTGAVEIQTYTFRFQFTEAELTDFKTFWRTDLEGGTLFFTISLPGGGADMIDMSVRPMGEDYSCNYVNYDSWEVSFAVGREVIQDIPEPTSSPVPVWYRPTIIVAGDRDVEESEVNALFKASPATGGYYTLTVPDITQNIGVQLDGLGAVLVVKESGDPGIGEIVIPPTLLEVINSKTPYAVWGPQLVVETSGSITQLTDRSGNGRHLNDAQTGTARATLATGAIATTENTRAFLGSFAAGALPSKFHLFMVIEAGAALLAKGADVGFVFAPGAAVNGNYAWSMSTTSGNWTSSGGFGSAGQLAFNGSLDASKKMLLELIYDGSTSRQNVRLNGLDAWSNYANFSHANFTWTSLRFGSNSGGAGTIEALRFFDIALFDTTGGALSAATLNDLRQAFFTEYPDTMRATRLLV